MERLLAAIGTCPSAGARRLEAAQPDHVDVDFARRDRLESSPVGLYSRDDFSLCRRAPSRALGIESRSPGSRLDRDLD